MAVKTLMCNIALRNETDPFPPVAITAIINYLRKYGYDAEFFDIDGRRPTDEKVIEYFRKEKFDIVGISAVVSTGYAYTKNLAHLIKKASPSTQIIVGGNMAAVYEVLLRKCEIDLCGIGEGEKVMLEVVKYYDRHRSFSPVTEELKSIKGIAFLDEKKQLIYTGTGELVDKQDLAEPDYDILAMYTDLGFYVQDPFMRPDFSQDARSHEPQRIGQKMATLFTAKGCVNTCTFCHRWVKGYRVFPVDKVIENVKKLKEKHNIGFFCFNDECFGEDIRWLNEFINRITPLDVLFQVGGVRVGIVKKDPTMIGRLKKAGMVAMYFGMESGCDKILAVMEKRADREANIRAAQVCAEEGIYTEIQLIVGMPGENDETIKDTIDFAIKVTRKGPTPPMLSVNYLQSLPGTPSYDFLKHHGLVGKEVDQEEEYLMSVSDKNACEFTHYINVTESPLTHVMTWQKKLVYAARIAWLKERGWKFRPEDLVKIYGSSKSNCPWYSVGHLRFMIKTSPWFYRGMDLLGENFWKIIIIGNTFTLYPFPKAIKMLLGLTKEDRSKYIVAARSLKKIVTDLDTETKKAASADQLASAYATTSAVVR